MQYNNILRAIFDGYKESKTFEKRQHAKKFNELNYTPYLFSDKYLKELYLDIETVDDCNILINYMDRFELTGKGYDFCEQLYSHTVEERDKKLKKKENDKDDWLNWV